MLALVCSVWSLCDSVQRWVSACYVMVMYWHSLHRLAPSVIETAARHCLLRFALLLLAYSRACVQLLQQQLLHT